MHRTFLRGARAAILALAFIALGCESATDPVGSPQLEIENSTSSLLSGEESESTLAILERSSSLLVEQTEILLFQPGTSAEINLLGHTLKIPADAVERPTYFVMIVLPGTQVQVELHAVDAETGLDVGGNGFKTAVQLALSYADLNGVKDPYELTIAYIPHDGAPEQLVTTIDDTAQTASAHLEHFSRYALCRN